MLALAVAGALLVGWLRPTAAGKECPEPKVQPDFEIERYLGPWFLISLAGTPPLSLFLDNRCIIIYNEEGTASSGPVMTLTSRGRHMQTGEKTEASVIVDIIGPGMFNKSQSAGENSMEDMFWVLGTNYETWGVGESCVKQTAWGDHSVFCWIISRNSSRQFSVEDENDINKVLEANGFDRSQFIDTNIDGYCDKIYEDLLPK